MDQLTAYENVTTEVHNELLSRTSMAIDIGLNPEQIIWDPGLGFAKTIDQNLILLKEIDLICSDSFPVLVGPSRKRFIGDVLDIPNPEERLYGTAAVVCRCVQAKVAMVRVHDVRPISQTISMATTLW